MAMRAIRIVFACCLTLGGAPLAVGCESRSGEGEATCSDIGCGTAIDAAFPVDVVGARAGAVRARVCLDGTCTKARGTFTHRGTFEESGGGRPPITVTLYEAEFHVAMDVPLRRVDDMESHLLEVAIRIQDHDPVVIDRATTFERYEPNGPECGPTCFRAKLHATSGDVSGS